MLKFQQGLCHMMGGQNTAESSSVYENARAGPFVGAVKHGRVKRDIANRLFNVRNRVDLFYSTGLRHVVKLSRLAQFVSQPLHKKPSLRLSGSWGAGARKS